MIIFFQFLNKQKMTKNPKYYNNDSNFFSTVTETLNYTKTEIQFIYNVKSCYFESYQFTNIKHSLERIRIFVFTHTLFQAH